MNKKLLYVSFIMLNIVAFQAEAMNQILVAGQKVSQLMSTSHIAGKETVDQVISKGQTLLDEGQKIIELLSQKMADQENVQAFKQALKQALANPTHLVDQGTLKNVDQKKLKALSHNLTEAIRQKISAVMSKVSFYEFGQNLQHLKETPKNIGYAMGQKTVQYVGETATHAWESVVDTIDNKTTQLLGHNIIAEIPSTIAQFGDMNSLCKVITLSALAYTAFLFGKLILPQAGLNASERTIHFQTVAALMALYGACITISPYLGDVIISTSILIFAMHNLPTDVISLTNRGCSINRENWQLFGKYALATAVFCVVYQYIHALQS